MCGVVPTSVDQYVAQGVPRNAAVVGPIDRTSVVVQFRIHVVLELHGVDLVAVQQEEGSVERTLGHVVVGAGQLGNPRLGAVAGCVDDGFVGRSKFPIVRQVFIFVVEAQPSWSCRIFKIVAIPTGGGDGHFVQCSKRPAQKVIRGQVVLLVVGAGRFHTNVVGAGTAVDPNLVKLEPTRGSAKQRGSECNGLVRTPCASIHLVPNAAGIQLLGASVLQTNLDVGGISRDDQVFARVHNNGCC